MKKLLTILCLVLLVSCSNEVPLDKLVVRQGITYEINSTKPFTGQSVRYWKSVKLSKDNELVGVENIRERVSYRNGKLDGPWEDFNEDGQLNYRENYKDGELDGLQESFHDNGQLETRGNFIDGKQEGLWEEFDTNGNLTKTEMYRNEELDGLQVRSELVANLPEFTLTNLAGESQSIKSWPGHALIINFWATWCTPCIREIPLLKEFQETNNDKPIQVVGIAVDRFEPVKNFAKNMTFNYPVLIGQSEAMDAANAFGVDFYGLPFSVFTDTNGSVLGVHTGELKSGDLDEVLNLLNNLESGATDLRTAKAILTEKM